MTLDAATWMLDPHLGPLEAAATASQPCALAIIVGTEGPSYRSIGAAMTIFADETVTGSLSSGCVESDIVMHALAALSEDVPVSIRYGTGSPFFDIVLPCGGGMDVLILPRPDHAVLRQALDHLDSRQSCCLKICENSGHMACLPPRRTEKTTDGFFLNLQPNLRFLVFGKGPETVNFASLTKTVGFETIVFSPDPETLGQCAVLEGEAYQLRAKSVPDRIVADAWTAAVLFFHDHDWEPPILAELLKLDLPYIGAQGSAKARAVRNCALKDLGISNRDLEKIRGPIGVIPSARDARTLAISVLAEVVETTQAKPI